MSFAAPLFLMAALAGLIPLVLHMINRQKAPVLPFATLRFLKLSAERTRRRKYLHDAMLLALRVAALVLLAVALAQPAIRNLHALLGGNSCAAVIVLDNSASMAAVEPQRNRWDAALKASRQVLDQLQDGDRVGLLVTCGPPGPEANRLFSNQDVVRQALDACQVSSERANLPVRLLQARKLLAGDDAANKEIYVITDLQAASWEGSQAEHKTDLAETSQAPVILVDVFRDAAPNLALRRVEVDSLVPAVGAPMQVTAEVFGAAAHTQQARLEMYLDGERKSASPTLTVGPGAAVQHAFSFALDRPGVHRGEVRLAGEDALALDNRRYFAVTADPTIPVAVVKAAAHEIPYLDDTFYLQRALNPAGGIGPPAGEPAWAIRVTNLLADGLASQPLSGFAVVYCVNLPAPEPAAAERLRDYVRAGGHLVWVCGDNVDPRAYNAANARLQGALLPAPLGEVRKTGDDRPDGWRLGWLDPRHAVLGPLAEPASVVQSVRVVKRVELAGAARAAARARANSDLRVLARLDDGQPILVERRLGAGTVLMWGATAHVDWTNLPVRPLFVPLVAGLTFHLAGAKTAQSQVIAGAPLVAPLSPTGKPAKGQPISIEPAPVEVLRPSGDVWKSKDPASGGKVFRYVDTHETGTYLIRVPGAQRQLELAYAVNLDPAECEPDRIGREDLLRRFGLGKLIFCDDPDKLAGAIHQLREGQGLRDLFLIVVFAALIAESFVANRLGGQASRTGEKSGNVLDRSTFDNQGERHDTLPDALEVH